MKLSNLLFIGFLSGFSLAFPQFASAGFDSNAKLTVLDYLNSPDSNPTITLSENINVDKNVQMLKLNPHGEWACFAKLKETNNVDGFVLHARTMPVISYTNTAETETKLRDFVWWFGNNWSGLTESETRRELLFILDDETLREIKCVSSPNHDTIDDLEDVISPFKLNPAAPSSDN